MKNLSTTGVKLRPMSKRRMLRFFTKYSNTPIKSENKRNIDALEAVHTTMGASAYYNANMSDKQSKIFVKNAENVLKAIISGRFNSDNDNHYSKFLREWTGNCRGLGWFAYCQKRLSQAKFDRRTILCEDGVSYRVVYTKVVPETKEEDIIYIDGKPFEQIFKLEVEDKEFAQNWLRRAV